MALEKSMKVSAWTHEQLAAYRDEKGHTSFDSAIRELLNEADE